MYKIFDNFISMDPWKQLPHHPNDQKRFYKILKNVINNKNFHPDEMGKYFAQKAEVNKLPQDAKNAVEDSIERWVLRAWAVKDYLESNNGQT